MWKLLPIIFLFSVPAARADLTHKLSTSTQLTVNAGITQTERIGSSFSISGTGIDTTDGTTANTVSAGAITSGVYAPGTILSSGVMTIVAGGAGTTATGQFVSTISVD